MRSAPCLAPSVTEAYVLRRAVDVADVSANRLSSAKEGAMCLLPFAGFGSIGVAAIWSVLAVGALIASPGPRPIGAYRVGLTGPNDTPFGKFLPA